MTTLSIFSLFTVMLVLAAIPSSSVLIVISRSTSYGIYHGVLAALGIVSGDLLFVLIAVLGLTFLADSFGELFIWIKYLGVSYLLWMSVSMWRSPALAGGVGDAKGDFGRGKSSGLSSYLSGLLFTLADQKAILFYLGLFPVFVDLSTITSLDIVIIILITVIAVGGVKIIYAVLALKAVAILDAGKRRLMNKVAAILVAGCAVYVVLPK